MTAHITRRVAATAKRSISTSGNQFAIRPCASPLLTSIRTFATEKSEVVLRPANSYYGWHTLQLTESLDIPRIPEPKPTHNLLTCTLTLTTHNPSHLPFLLYFSRHSAHALGLPVSPPIHLPTNTKKYYVIKGPFVHAKTKEVFEEKKYSGCVQIFDGEKSVVDDWVEYVKKNLPAGVDVETEKFEFTGVQDAVKSRIEGVESAVEVKTEATPKGRRAKRKSGISFQDEVEKKAAEFIQQWASKGKAKK